MTNETYDFQDTTPNVPATDRFKSTRADIMREVKKLRKGESITYGRLSRYVNQGRIDLLDAALSDLCADGLVRWDRNAPMPTRIYKA